MNSYLMTPAVLDPLIPHLTSISYGNLLCTCKEINENFDYHTEWKKRIPNIKYNLKKCCMIKDGIKEYGALTLLNEITNQKNLYTLIQAYRVLNPPNLMDIYYEHLHSKDCWFSSIIRIERDRLGRSKGMNIRTRKRKYIKDRHVYKMEHNRRHLHHMLRRQLQLDR